MKKLTLLWKSLMTLCCLMINVTLFAQSQPYDTSHPSHLAMEDLDNNTQGRCQNIGNGEYIFNFTVTVVNLEDSDRNPCDEGETCYFPKLTDPLYLKYTVGTTVSDPILLDDFEYVDEEVNHSHDGLSTHLHDPVVYQQTITTDPISENPHCNWMADPNIPVTLELLTIDDEGNYEPYPIEDNNNQGQIFDCTRFMDICCDDGSHCNGLGSTNYNPTVASGNVPICCGSGEGRSDDYTQSHTHDHDDPHSHGHDHHHHSSKHHWHNQMSVNPNPFREHLWIDYELAQNAEVNIQLIDINGKIVKEMNFKQAKGQYTEKLMTGDLARGIYYCKIETSTGFSTTHKVIKMK